MSGSLRLALALALLAPAATSAREPDPWRVWHHDLRRQCPSHHVDWIAAGGYDDLLTEFEVTLLPRVQSKIARIANAEYGRRCAGAEGSSCEMGAHLDTYRRLDLMEQFTRFGCDHVRCEDVTICSTFPRVR